MGTTQQVYNNTKSTILDNIIPRMSEPASHLFYCNCHLGLEQHNLWVLSSLNLIPVLLYPLFDYKNFVSSPALQEL